MIVFDSPRRDPGDPPSYARLPEISVKISDKLPVPIYTTKTGASLWPGPPVSSTISRSSLCLQQTTPRPMLICKRLKIFLGYIASR